jgi:hypothetical protein
MQDRVNEIDTMHERVDKLDETVQTAVSETEALRRQLADAHETIESLNNEVGNVSYHFEQESIVFRAGLDTKQEKIGCGCVLHLHIKIDGGAGK